MGHIATWGFFYFTFYRIDYEIHFILYLLAKWWLKTK